MKNSVWYHKLWRSKLNELPVNTNAASAWSDMKNVLDKNMPVGGTVPVASAAKSVAAKVISVAAYVLPAAVVVFASVYYLNLVNKPGNATSQGRRDSLLRKEIDTVNKFRFEDTATLSRNSAQAIADNLKMNPDSSNDSFNSKNDSATYTNHQNSVVDFLKARNQFNKSNHGSNNKNVINQSLSLNRRTLSLKNKIKEEKVRVLDIKRIKLLLKKKQRNKNSYIKRNKIKYSHVKNNYVKSNLYSKAGSTLNFNGINKDVILNNNKYSNNNKIDPGINETTIDLNIKGNPLSITNQLLVLDPGNEGVADKISVDKTIKSKKDKTPKAGKASESEKELKSDKVSKVKNAKPDKISKAKTVKKKQDIVTPSYNYGINAGLSISGSKNIYLGVFGTYALNKRWMINGGLTMNGMRSIAGEYSHESYYQPDSLPPFKIIDSRKIIVLDIPLNVEYKVSNKMSIKAGPVFGLSLKQSSINSKVAPMADLRDTLYHSKQIDTALRKTAVNKLNIGFKMGISYHFRQFDLEGSYQIQTPYKIKSDLGSYTKSYQMFQLGIGYRFK